MDISVVIPTFNRSRLLARTIPALMNQCADGFEYEVIFVSNGSADETESVLRQAAEQYGDRFRYFVIEPTGGPSAPRNVGIRASRASAVIILDDDVLPDSNMVRSHVQFHRQNPGAAYAAVGEVYVPPEMLSDPMSLFHTFPYDEIPGLAALSYLHFWTCNVSVKRAFMMAHGMFDEKFLYYEDILCGHRLAQAGMELRFLPEARGQHLHQLRPSGVPAKGNFTGRWLYAFLEAVPDPAAKRRFGVLSRDIGGLAFAKRCLGRPALWCATSALSLACLKAMGGEDQIRNRRTDRYYRRLFQRYMLKGYGDARRESAGRAITIAENEWEDRGESLEK